MAWKLSANGVFTLKSTYSSFAIGLQINGGEVNQKLFKTVWKCKGIQRVKLFLLKVANNILLKNEQWAVRHMTEDPCCPRCPGMREVAVHLFRDCFHSVQVWKALVPPDLLVDMFCSDTEAWLLFNLSSGKCYIFSIPPGP